VSRRTGRAIVKTPFALTILLVIAGSVYAGDVPLVRYAVATRIAGPPTGSWDYAIIDPHSRKLYLASDGILVLDLGSQTVRRLNVAGKSMHGLALIDDGVLAVADGARNQVEFFDGATGNILSSVATGAPPTSDGWHNPDALLVEPVSGLLVAVNGDSGAIVLIDTKTRVRVGDIKIGGKLEFAAAIGDGLVAVNIESRDTIAVVDVVHRKVVRKIAMKHCDSPTGLAYDQIDRLAISVCSNGVAKFVDPHLGLEVASRHVGKGADAILYDPMRRTAFATAGDDGTLTVIAVNGRKDIKVTQTINTEPGVRLGAIDIETGRLYLPAVRYDKSLQPIILPGLPPMPAPIPDTFEFLVAGGI
jgi:DNA-binding beta-propeller fold protein YncE